MHYRTEEDSVEVNNTHTYTELEQALYHWLAINILRIEMAISCNCRHSVLMYGVQCWTQGAHGGGTYVLALSFLGQTISDLLG